MMMMMMMITILLIIRVETIYLRSFCTIFSKHVIPSGVFVDTDSFSQSHPSITSSSFDKVVVFRVPGRFHVAAISSFQSAAAADVFVLGIPFFFLVSFRFCRYKNSQALQLGFWRLPIFSEAFMPYGHSRAR